MPSPPNDGEDQGASPMNGPSVGSYQSSGKRKVRMKKKKGSISANVVGTKYEIVRIVINEMDFMKTRDDDETANLIWNDSAVQHEKIAELRNYQRINHFPGMGEICRKDCLARNMSKMIKCQPQEYSFIPKTWIFPAEYTQFQNYVKELRRKRKQKTFIVKPANGAMGHGISLIRNCEKLPAQEHFIVQEYLDKPFLMEGYKFDLRIYILVTSCDPLRIFLYNDGLVRMGTEKYHAPSEANLSQLYMHLTNYSVNKHNENFERDETVDKGSKRSISWFTEFLRTNDYDVAKFWGDVSELVVKTLIVAEPHVLHAYRMCRPGQPPGSDSVCFEVLGFDIILDRKLKPWLLEINRAPSFGTDQKIDYDVKKGVLLDALRLLNIRASDKKRNLAQQKAEAQRRLYGHGSVKKLSATSSDWEKQRHTLERRREELKERLAQVRKQISREEHEKQHLGNYRRIYPPDDKLLLEKYESLLSAAFQTFLAGRAASLQKEMNNPLKQMKEEDILDLLEQCELDDEKLMGKSSRQRGPKPLTAMPECSQTPRRQRPDYLADFTSGSSAENSCSSSDEDEEEEEDRRKSVGGGGRGGEKKEKKVSYDLGESKDKNVAERSGRMHWKPPVKSPKTNPAPSASPTLSGPIRRSISCPRSIASLSSPSEVRALCTRPSPTLPVATPLIRPSSATLRSHSLSRSGSAYRVPHSNSLGTIHTNMGDALINLRSKEQEAELVHQTLAALTAMRIRFPGKTEEEAEAVLDEILDNWKYHKPKVASYWLVKLDSTKQRKVLDIVRTNVRSALQRIWREPDVDSLHLYRLFNRVFNRLLWSHGQGLWNCFSNTGSSWETIFSKSSEVVSPKELQCCRRLVQLCRDCLLVVYKFVSESRGSLTGLSPEWDDTSFPFAAGPASTHGSTPAAVAAASSSSSSSVSSPLNAGTGTLLAGAASLLCLGGRCHRKVLERF
ncbi:tubulin polyglutamylase TTLL7 isoform X1 [Solea solea]|uniref:tubulin polyglutamylase TTLL7 isoform X1 n=1 Tax=Solea solea TaxID=90069 RepID=UPI00272B01EF|nr:tubulin polyglutamylase TTLL7 isoform X1 [Solea solea]XP_058494751.1 tubulin polyglutamylase TTLL7 isoform X1 [Solea solea]